MHANKKLLGAPLCPSTTLTLTGERTLPHIASENYWFTRHEIAYQYIAPLLTNQRVLDAGVGEGYGADILSSYAAEVVAVDYNQQVVEHIRATYPHIDIHQANLADLPFAPESFDSVINFQVIEHLWDQQLFLTQVFNLLKPGGFLYISTPNRLTFSPDNAKPLNHFHTREFSPSELIEILADTGFFPITTHGIFHGEALTALDHKWNGSIIDTQITALLSDEGITGELLHDIAQIQWEDFTISTDNLSESLDLFYIATKPN